MSIETLDLVNDTDERSVLAVGLVFSVFLSRIPTLSPQIASTVRGVMLVSYVLCFDAVTKLKEIYPFFLQGKSELGRMAVNCCGLQA